MKYAPILLFAFISGCSPRPQEHVTFRVVCKPPADSSSVYVTGDEWAGGRVPEDDVTFVVLKVK